MTANNTKTVTVMRRSNGANALLSPQTRFVRGAGLPPLKLMSDNNNYTICEDCHDRTGDPWNGYTGNGKCRHCRGSGETSIGPFGIGPDITCGECDGTGICQTCDGEGVV